MKHIDKKEEAVVPVQMDVEMLMKKMIKEEVNLFDTREGTAQLPYCGHQIQAKGMNGTYFHFMNIRDGLLRIYFQEVFEGVIDRLIEEHDLEVIKLPMEESVLMMIEASNEILVTRILNMLQRKRLLTWNAVAPQPTIH